MFCGQMDYNDEEIHFISFIKEKQLFSLLLDQINQSLVKFCVCVLPLCLTKSMSGHFFAVVVVHLVLPEIIFSNEEKILPL